MALIGDKSTWRKNNQALRLQRGALIRVQHPDGHWSNMRTQNAIDAGLIPGEKSAPDPGDKQAPPPENKGTSPAPDVTPDDLTTVSGVGRASARSLNAQGIMTLAALRTADLDRLNIAPNVRKAIEAWRE